jgi:ribonuclease P protein component
VGNAVVRNRIRRRLRPIVLDHAASLAPGLYLVGVKDAQTASISHEELRNDLQAVLSKAAERVAR